MITSLRVLLFIKLCITLAIANCPPSNECLSLPECSPANSDIFFYEKCSNNPVKYCCERKTPIRGTVIGRTTTTKKPSTVDPIIEKDLEFDLNTCGPVYKGNRIAYGQDANLLEFPWFALIGYTKPFDEIQFRCGGSLINQRFVLTAAHCVKRNRMFTDLAIVRLGEHTISKTRDCVKLPDNTQVCADPVQDIPLSPNDITPHPDYNQYKKFNDIAIIRLQKRAKTSQNNIKPICLPFDLGPNYLPQKLIVIGTGATESKSSSDVLQWVKIDLVNHTQCRKKFEDNYRFSLTDDQICAGDHRDSCGGDSGSSLHQIERVDENLQAYQFGIVSYGRVICGNEDPGIYAKVSSYLDWILNVVNRYY